MSPSEISNAVSIMVRISHGGRSILVTGDAIGRPLRGSDDETCTGSEGWDRRERGSGSAERRRADCFPSRRQQRKRESASSPRSRQSLSSSLRAAGTDTPIGKPSLAFLQRESRKHISFGLIGAATARATPRRGNGPRRPCRRVGISRRTMTLTSSSVAMAASQLRMWSPTVASSAETKPNIGESE